MVAEPYIVVSQSKNLLRAECLLPRALVRRLYEEKKKKHPGNPAEMALSDRGIFLWRILYVSRKCVPALLLSVVGQLPTFAPSSLARVAQKASEKKMASKLHGISQLVIIFLCFFVLHFKKGESTYK